MKFSLQFGSLFSILALSAACSSASSPSDGNRDAVGSGGAHVAASGGGLSDATGGTGSGTGGQVGATGGAAAGPSIVETDQTAAELIASLDLGWNLGNTLDAPESETAWGNPTVTPALLQAVAALGFDIVRVPVTWSKHTGPAPDFTLDADFLSRVEEVVGYVNEAGMYAIINLHHDGADGYADVEWLTLNDAEGAITTANNDAVKDRFVKVWTQIAEHFKDHGPGLIFESMNEIHDGYGNPVSDYYTIINTLNQVFVDTVRASGGNNPTRQLVVPGYNTNIDFTVAGFVAPTDPTPDHLILSAHFYDPYLYALEGTTHTWGAASPGSDGWGQEAYVTAQFDKLKSNFGDKGLPVILGEYGAVQQDGYEDYRRYYMEYVTKAATDRGIVPIYWDNGSTGTGTDAFGLINRADNTVLRPSILEAMIRAATSTYTLSDVALPTQ